MLGSCCGSVVRAVASDIRGPRFESQVIGKTLFIVNCIKKTKMKKNDPVFKKQKEAGLAHQ